MTLDCQAQNWKISEEEKDVVKRLAKHGNTQQMIATYLGVARTTLFRDPETCKIYKHHKSHGIDLVTQKAFMKALDDNDGPMQMFILKTKAHWRESSSFFDLPGFDGNYAKKCNYIDKCFREQELPLEAWALMHSTLSKRFENEELDNRLRKLEERQNG